MTRTDSVEVPLQFRRRLTITLVFAVFLAASALAVGSYVVVDAQRNDAFTRRSLYQARAAISLVEGGTEPSSIEPLANVSRNTDGFEALIVSDTVRSSDPEITQRNIPPNLEVRQGELHSARTKINGTEYMVVASEVTHGTKHSAIYLWFSRQPLRSSLGQLLRDLILGVVAVTALAAVAARLLAIRTLAPIQAAAEAARLRAEGLLHTQLDGTKSDEFRAWARYFDDIAGALEVKIAELSAAHERERRFTADVAHDLRTPLGAMVSATSLLKEHINEMPEGARRPAELLITDVQRFRRLVVDLLEISRLDSAGEVLSIESIDLEHLVSGVVSGVGGTGRVAVHCPLGVRMQSDRVRLERVLSNLIDNALEHAGTGVEVVVDASGDDVVFDVVDRGPGIPEDQLPHIFDRFHKVSQSRSTDGSGLGLAIAARHAALLGATITVSNRSADDGGGVRFRVVVPEHAIGTQERPTSVELV